MYWTKEEDGVVKANYYEIPVKELMELLPGRTQASIELRAKRKLGLDKDKRTQRKYQVNMQFFDEPNILNSYWAGFIAADGCLTLKKHLVSFGIHWDDGYLLEQFVKDIDFEGEVVYSVTGQGNRRAGLYIWGVEPWFRSLKKHYNLEPQKSLTLMPPNLIDTEHIKSYIKGYIDGDGGIYPVIKNNKWVVSIRGTKATLNFIKLNFDRWSEGFNWHGNTGANVVTPKGDAVDRYTLSGDRSLSILNQLLEVPTPYLTRKWQSVIDYLKNNPL